MRHTPSLSNALLVCLSLSAGLGLGLGASASVRAESALVINNVGPLRVVGLNTATDVLSATGLQLQSSGAGGLGGDCAIDPSGARGYAAVGFGSGSGIVPLNLPAASAGPRIVVPNAPNDVDLTPDGRFLLVAYFNAVGENGPLSVIDTSTNTIVQNKIPASGDAQSVDVCDDGSSVVIGDDANKKIGLLSLSSGGVLSDVTNQSVPTGGLALHNAYCAPGSRSAIAAAGGGALHSFLLPGLTPVSNIAVQAQSAAFAPDGKRLYVRSFNSVVRALAFDPATGVIGAQLWQTTVTGGTGFFGRDELALSPDGGKLYVPEAGVLRVLDAATGASLSNLTNADLTSASAICVQPPVPVGPPPPRPAVGVSSATGGQTTSNNPVTGGPAGTFDFKATFCNGSANTYLDAFSLTTVLSNGNQQLSRTNAGEPSGVGATQNLPDASLTPGECVVTPYRIGLASRAPFTFRVNLLTP